jgi:hypothetical protein
LLGRTVEDSEVFDQLRSVAVAQESIALNLPRSVLRSSAAFVAATAYQILHESSQIDVREGLLNADEIAPLVSALLLFIVADAPADASDVAGKFPLNDGQPFSSLLKSLRALGDGTVRPASVDDEPWAETLPSTAAGIAAMVGYERCSKHLAALLRHVTEPSRRPWAEGGFAEIAVAMAQEFVFEAPQGVVQAESLFLGPWHLARLLDMAEPQVLEAATSSVAAPPGLQAEAWRLHLSRLSRRRPLLWRNHRDAIESGLLEAGTSAVIAFPTGAGKSTVSELKIAATVMRGRSVVCLVPTLSLIDQFSAELRSMIPSARVIAQRDLDEELPAEDAGSAEIFIMTPESCLAILGADPERFGDIGLVLFDEAHLMHAEHEEPSRRALDATLCFLGLSARYPTADLVLISAMFANAPDLARWLESLTGRSAVALDDPWKPTRQARGALLYESEEIGRLRRLVADTFAQSSNLTPPSSLKRQMLATARGFFSLMPTWESTSARDYRLIPLLESQVELNVGGHRQRDEAWWLNPNANQVAGRLASAAASAGMKTLVFTQQVVWATSLARDVTEAMPTTRTPLKADERLLADRAAETLGDPEAMYLTLDDGSVVGSAIPHHGLLLPEERKLHEKLYKRPDGLPVMVATSTVAQGMNFPSQFVVIAGDKRFDAESNRRLQLEAHELLNAAGRAGRAGSHSNGLVLVIPGQVVTYDGGQNMDKGWFLLQEAFSKSDQCLEMRDPIVAMLEQIGADEVPELQRYFVRRTVGAGDEHSQAQVLGRSFSAYVAVQEGRQAWLDQRLAALASLGASDGAPSWAKRLTAVTGLPATDIVGLGEQLVAELEDDHDILWWRDWLIEFLADRSSLLEQVLRTGSRAALLGTTEELGDWAITGSQLIENIRTYLPMWMAGATLKEIHDHAVGQRVARRNRHFEYARKFVLRVLPDLSYLFGLPLLVMREMNAPDSEGLADHPLAYLPRCVEKGVDSVPKLLLLETEFGFTRLRAHQASV